MSGTSRQKYNSDKLEMVQRRAARFVKGRYGMFESVTQMLEQLTWIPLSKRRENSSLILFYKIINNLAVVPHSCLEKADVRTRKNILKSSATSVTTLIHMDNCSFQTVLVSGMVLLKPLQRLLCVLLAQWLTWLTRDRCNPKVPSSIPAGGKDFL